jgi:tetratricopeptide (TPR) repeat protein
VAEALEQQPGEPPVELLAYHYGRSGEPEQAVRYLELAGDRAREQAAHGAAEEYYREVVARLDALGRAIDAARVREKLGAVLLTTAHYKQALSVLEEAAETLRLVGDLKAVARVVARIGNVHVAIGTLAEGVARLRPLLEQLAARGPSHGLAALSHAQASLLFMHGQFREALSAALQAAEVARALGDVSLLAEAEVAHGWTLGLMGRDDEALPVLQEAGKLADAVGNLECCGTALTYAALILEQMGEFETARLYTARALIVGERLANPHLVADALIRLAAQAFFAGTWTQARAYIERVEALPDRTPWHDSAPLLELGRLELAEGAWKQAAAHLEECSGIARHLGVRIQDRVAESLLAERDVLEGRPAVAVARLLPQLDRVGLEERVVTIFVLPTLAWAYLELGETDQAARTIEGAIRRAREARYRFGLVGALRVQAIIAVRQDDPDLAERALEEGLCLARAMPYPHGEGRLLEVYGQLHLSRGESAAARERLEAALNIFRRLGACKDAELTEQLLATLG